MEERIARAVGPRRKMTSKGITADFIIACGATRNITSTCQPQVMPATLDPGANVVEAVGLKNMTHFVKKIIIIKWS